MLLAAYAQGMFPMAHAESEWEVLWYAPDPRAIIEFDGFHISKNLARTVRKAPFDIRRDTAFEEVMRICSAPRSDEDGTWISEGLIAAYTELHELVDDGLDLVRHCGGPNRFSYWVAWLGSFRLTALSSTRYIPALP